MSKYNPDKTLKTQTITDPNGNITVSEYNPDGTPKKVTSTTKDANKNEIRKIEVQFNANGKPTSEKTTIFDANRKTISIIIDKTLYGDAETADKQMVTKQTVTTFDRDVNRKLIRKVEKKSDGRTTTYSYEYPNDGGRVKKKEIVTYFNGRQVENHYDGSGTKIEEIEINPGNKQVYVQSSDKLSDLYPTPDALTVTFKVNDEIHEVRTEADVRKYLEQYSSHFKSDKINKFVKLFNAHPKRFNRIANSGFFDLVNRGYISREKASDLLQWFDGEHISFSHRTLAEIKMVKEQLDAGITNPSLVQKMPSEAGDNWVYDNIKPGGVYERDGKLFVREDTDTFTELKLSKEKFDELFPPLSSTFNQGTLSDCWLVSSIDNLMDYPAGRAAIFKMFEQQGNDIFVTFKNNNDRIPFYNSEVLDNKGKQIKGANGIQMLEFAYAKHRNGNIDQKYLSEKQIANLTNQGYLMEQLSSGSEMDAFENIVGHNARRITNLSEVSQIIENSANSVDDIIGIHFPKGCKLSVYNIYGPHVYALKSFDPDTQMCYLTNPWNTSTLIEVPYNVIMKNVHSIDIMSFK